MVDRPYSKQVTQVASQGTANTSCACFLPWTIPAKSATSTSVKFLPKTDISTSLRTVYEHDFQVVVALTTLKLCWRMLACCWYVVDPLISIAAIALSMCAAFQTQIDWDVTVCHGLCHNAHLQCRFDAGYRVRRSRSSKPAQRPKGKFTCRRSSNCSMGTDQPGQPGQPGQRCLPQWWMFAIHFLFRYSFWIMIITIHHFLFYISFAFQNCVGLTSITSLWTFLPCSTLPNRRSLTALFSLKCSECSYTDVIMQLCHFVPFCVMLCHVSPMSHTSHTSHSQDISRWCSRRRCRRQGVL